MQIKQMVNESKNKRTQKRYFKLTCQENSSNKYRFVAIAKAIINKIINPENPLSILTKKCATLFIYLCIKNPIANGTINATAYMLIWEYGTARFPLSKITLPNVKIHKGIMPNAAKVQRAVIVTERSMFPSKRTVHMLDAPPEGEQPVKKNPSCISGLSGKRNLPKR